MAQGDSVISIVNSALIALGEDPIVSLQDDTKRAILANIRWDPVRRAVLRSHPWKSAMQQTQLALTTYAPLVIFDYAYQLPADCLRFYDLPDNGLCEWEVGQDAVAGQLLFTNESPPLAGQYIRDLTDPTRFDSLLIDVLSWSLAIDLCIPLTEDKAKKQQLQADLKGITDTAKLTESDEQSSKEWDDDVWLRSRR